MVEKITFIIEKLNDFKGELEGIHSLAHVRSDRDLGNQKFKRWKERVVFFLKENISEKEAKECEDLSYPMVMESSKFQNFDSKIKACNSYLAALIDELKSNPDFLFGEQKKLSKKIISKEEKIKIFISYSTADKKIAKDINQLLEKWGLSVFLAHEDIEVSEEWKEVIRKNLLECQIFIPILTENFKKSDWTSQELGIVLGRDDDILIIPLMRGENIPYGFISHIQGKNLEQEGLEYSIIKMVSKKYRNNLLDKLMDFLKNSLSSREAEFRLFFVIGCLEPLDKNIINRILEITLENENRQILYATECKKWLKEQLRNNSNIERTLIDKFKKLPEYSEEL